MIDLKKIWNKTIKRAHLWLILFGLIYTIKIFKQK